MKPSEIKEMLQWAKGEELESLLKSCDEDSRATVRKLAESKRKQMEELKAEKRRVKTMLAFENEYSDYNVICGVDEAGRGPLAGPVVAGAVVLPKNTTILYVNDSKKLSEKKREELYDIIMSEALCVGVGVASAELIDEINILQATYEAMRQAIDSLPLKPDLLLNDAVTIPRVGIKQVPIVKGDAKSLSIAAASIIAKVTRDRMMREYDILFPEYGFAGHKGYGSSDHIAAIKKYGPSPIHRATFIKNFV